MNYPEEDSLPGLAFATRQSSPIPAVLVGHTHSVTPHSSVTTPLHIPLSDSILDKLISIITFPICQEVTSSMVVFNKQCYDKPSFERHKSQEESQN